MDAARALMRHSPAEWGNLAVDFMTAKAATASDVKQWVRDTEQRWGEKASLVIVDMADHLSSGKEQRDYEAMGRVYSALFNWAAADQIWIWSASHTQRKSHKRKKPGVHDGADSQHKIRICDICIGLDPEDDDNCSMRYSVVKNRYGEGGRATGYLPTDYARARMVPLNDEKSAPAGTTALDFVF